MTKFFAASLVVALCTALVDVRADKKNEAKKSNEKKPSAASEFNPDRFFGSKPDQTGKPTPADSLRLLPGFKAEIVYHVPLKEQGSWVCMALDSKGRLLASDQERGLYRISDFTDRRTPKVERLDVKIGGCQGLLDHRGSLYAVVNGDRSGLYRLCDTNGDDQYDDVKLLQEFDDGGEHGPHAVIAAPDGESIFVIGGNGCYPRSKIKHSRVPMVWREDRLLNRTSASDGSFEAGENRNGGWIVRTDLDGRELELVAMGFRNPYDLAFNRDGELFTFDSDMEWDTGTPWYRPTRINHVISGVDFGWRAGTSKWPDHYLDSFGSVVDIGHSSPTGVTFGYGSKFPERYQNALFVCDWSLGNIYAIHLAPLGSTYTGEAEPFVTGAPLPVADVTICPTDGAMYFVTGGRGITSAIYRVTHVGETPAPANVPAEQSKEAVVARDQRKQLETLHSLNASADIGAIWTHLDSEDRGIRFAARIALKHQPVERWEAYLDEEKSPRRLIAAALAWTRHSDNTAMFIGAIGRINWHKLSTSDRADMLRAFMVALARRSQGANRDLLSRFTLRCLASAPLELFPTGDEFLDRDLAEILKFAGGAKVIDRVLQSLDAAPTQEAQIHYAMCLRDIEDGWTIPQRKRLLAWFSRTATQRGGVLFGEYLEQLHREVLGEIPEGDREQLKGLLALPAASDPYQDLKKRNVVQKWTIDEILKQLPARVETASSRRGAEVFRSALCYRCHRMNSRGGMVGPDLTNVRRRFNARDMLESIVEPDKVISDQYRAVQIVTDDGAVITGKVTDVHGNSLVIMNNVLDQADRTTVERDRIERMTWSSTSTMPAGLLDTFTPGDIADLLAFLTAGP